MLINFIKEVVFSTKWIIHITSLFSIFQHIKSNIIFIIIICLEIIKLYFSIFKPFLTFVEHTIIYWFEIFKLTFYIFQVFGQDSINCLFLNFKSGSHIWEFLFDFNSQILTFFLEMHINLINLLFIRWLGHSLLNNLIHFHQTFSSQIDFIKHIMFHSYIMRFMRTKKRALRANSFFTVNTDNFDFTLMNLA